jgi:micrococcal nuclease
MNPRVIILSLLFLFLLFGGTQKEFNQLFSLIASPTPTTKPSGTLGTSDKQTYLVTKIIDGDTIEIEGGQKVRYIGIDTPEIKGSECFAKEARDKNKELVENKRVRLQKDVSETDRYGRLLRFVYTENGDFINNILVKEGYATAATFPPDVSKQEEFKASQKDAVANNRGLWGETCSKP